MPDTTPPPPPAASPNATGSEFTGLAPNIAAGFACLFSIVGGIVILVLEKKDPFVRFWAMQSVFLGGVAMASSMAARIMDSIFRLIPVLGHLLIAITGLALDVLSFAVLIAYIISLVKAFSGQEWEIPILGKFARAQLAKMTPPVPPAAA